MKPALLPLLLLTFVNLAVAAEEGAAPSPIALPLSGRIFTDVYAPTRNPHDTEFQFVAASLWLQADPKLGENGSARILLSGDRIEKSTSVPAQFRTNLREGYVDYAAPGWELRVGRQILSWGKSDVINPTDFLSAKDYSFFNPDDEVRRQGATSVCASFTPGGASGSASPWSFTAVWTPVSAQSTLLISPTVLPAGITLSSAATSPLITLPNSEMALKAAYMGTGWDASVLFFRGWNHTPELVVASQSGVPPAVTATLTQAFHHVRALGGDVAYTTGSYTLRGETAYSWTENNDGRNPLVLPTHLDAVVGAERPFASDFRVQGQVVLRYFPRYTNPTDAGGENAVAAFINSKVAQANALLLNYQDRFRPASTLRVSYSNDTKGIDAEIFAMLNLVGGDYLLRPKFSYAWTDALKTTIGTDYYGGDEGRPLGALKSFDSLFVEARYAF